MWYPYYLNSRGDSRFFLPHDLFLQLVASITFILTWDLSGQDQDLHSICHSAWWLAKNSLQLPVNQVELHQGWCCLKFLHQCSRAREERKGKKGLGEKKRNDVLLIWMRPGHFPALHWQQQFRDYSWSRAVQAGSLETVQRPLTVWGIWMSSCFSLSRPIVFTIRWLSCVCWISRGLGPWGAFPFSNYVYSHLSPKAMEHIDIQI